MLIRFLTSHFYVVYIKKLVTVLYFSIINVLWLLNLCGAGGDVSFAPQANLVLDPDYHVITGFYCVVFKTNQEYGERLI